jgi:hypothetical protein
MDTIVEFAGFTCHVMLETYARGGTCIRLVDTSDQGPVATASSWIPGLQPDEVAIKDYSENQGMLDTLVFAGIVNPPHRMLDGFPICRLAGLQEVSV